ncbi:hypothetical protein Tco_1158484, partial [Tanacetum coccineum]
LYTAWQFNNHPQTLRSQLKPGRAQYCTVSGAIHGTATISPVKTKLITVNHLTYFSGMTSGREDTPPSGFLTLTPFPSPNVGEIPPIIASNFIVRSLKNIPLTNHASLSANLDPMISPTFVEANYEVLESLLRERRRQVQNEDLHTELDYYSEKYDEEKEIEAYHIPPKRKREA